MRVCFLLWGFQYSLPRSPLLLRPLFSRRLVDFPLSGRCLLPLSRGTWSLMCPRWTRVPHFSRVLLLLLRLFPLRWILWTTLSVAGSRRIALARKLLSTECSRRLWRLMPFVGLLRHPQSPARPPLGRLGLLLCLWVV